MILVDTHAVIWVTQEDKQLSKAAATTLADGRLRSGLAIADITLNEIADLITKRRVIVDAPLEVYLNFVESLFQVLPITGQIAARAVSFGRSYPKDPADRLIGATALVHNISLVTKDERIRASGEVSTIW